MLSVLRDNASAFSVRIAQAETRLTRYGDTLEQLKAKAEEFGAAQRQALSAEMAAAIDQLEQALKKQVGTFGQDAIAVRLYELSLKGATDQQLEFTRSLADQLTQLQAQAKIDSTVDSVTQRLREQIDTFGFGASEIDRYKLAIAGASEEQVNFVKHLQDQFAVMEKQAGLKTRAQEIRDELRTPAERLRARLEELQGLFKEGFFDESEFERMTARIKALASPDVRSSARSSPQLQAFEARFLTKAPASVRGKDFQQETAGNTKKALNAAAKQTKLLASSLEKLEQLVDRMPVIRIARI